MFFGTHKDTAERAEYLKSAYQDRYTEVIVDGIPASVFVELGNIQNSFDQQRIILSDNRQALANWLCEGFVTDYNRYRKKTR